MNANKSVLKKLAEEHVESDEMADLAFYLEYGELHFASALILGAIDRKWQAGSIEDEKARDAIKTLDLGPKDTAHLKTRSRCLRELF